MDTQFNIQPIDATFLLAKTVRGHLPYPVLIYKVKSASDDNYYAEIVDCVILGYGRSIEEAKEDVVELFDI
ncbi:hypothetical protein LFX13_17710, partial [Leptospira bandrabouensis]|nr:hypothetical protein [Leptospira bandrabouensis]